MVGGHYYEIQNHLGYSGSDTCIWIDSKLCVNNNSRHKALGISIQYFAATDIKQYFSDVNNGDVYSTALYDLATTGIIDYRGTFRPNAALPRDEMVHVCNWHVCD